MILCLLTRSSLASALLTLLCPTMDCEKCGGKCYNLRFCKCPKCGDFKGVKRILQNSYSYYEHKSYYEQFCDLSQQKKALKTNYDQATRALSNRYLEFTQTEAFFSEGGESRSGKSGKSDQVPDRWFSIPSCKAIMFALHMQGVTLNSSKLSMEELKTFYKDDRFEPIVRKIFQEAVNAILLTSPEAVDEVAGPVIEVCFMAGLMKHLATRALKHQDDEKLKNAIIQKSKKHRLKRRAIQDSRSQENVSSKSDLLSLDDLLEGLGEAKSGTKPKVKQMAKKEGRYSRPGVKGPKFKEEMIPTGLSRDPKSTEVIEDQETHTQKELAEEITWDESQEMYGHFTEVRNKKSRQRTKQVWLQIRCWVFFVSIKTAVYSY